MELKMINVQIFLRAKLHNSKTTGSLKKKTTFLVISFAVLSQELNRSMRPWTSIPDNYFNSIPPAVPGKKILKNYIFRHMLFHLAGKFLQLYGAIGLNFYTCSILIVMSQLKYISKYLSVLFQIYHQHYIRKPKNALFHPFLKPYKIELGSKFAGNFSYSFVERCKEAEKAC